MNLWTEFEGVTIDSAFSLTKLVQTEGRSAFFSTRNANGESVLIRIIECHFDEDEILARWHGVQTLGHPNFLRIDRFGQFHANDEDTVAVYAVFERVDANLAEVLKQGRLSPPDAAEIGLSISSALQTLHANGFVHEHIEAANIYAADNIVKLRSDCIRETQEGEAGLEARRRDVHDLAIVLSQVLLGMPCCSPAPNHALSAPFDEIVRNGIDGTWGLAEIIAALERLDLRKPAPKKVRPPLPALTRPEPSTTQAASPIYSAGNREFAAKSVSPLTSDKAARPEPQRERTTASASGSATQAELPWPKPSSMDLPVIFGISEHDFRKWRTAAALLIGVVFIGWLFLHYWSSNRAAAQPDAATSTASSVNTASGSDPDASPRTVVMPPASSTLPASHAGSSSRVEWRVVAFTYNHREQAEKKVLSLAQQHPTLWPATFSPNGKAPYLVTIGGVLQRDAAYALARKARTLGLPHDTYAQDYPAR